MYFASCSTKTYHKIEQISGLILILFYFWEPPRLGHTLVQHGSAAAADEVLQAVTQEAMLFEGNQCITVLPTDAEVLGTAALAFLHRKLFCHHESPLSNFQPLMQGLTCRLFVFIKCVGVDIQRGGRL